MNFEFWYQKVSSPLSIVLLLLMCFWTVLFYFTHRAGAIAEELSVSQQEIK